MNPKQQHDGKIVNYLKAIFRLAQTTDYHDREKIEAMKQGIANNLSLNLGLRYRIIKKIEQILHRKEY